MTGYQRNHNTSRNRISRLMLACAAACTMAIGLAACGSSGSAVSSTGSGSSASQDQTTPAPSGSSGGAESKVLIVYFSREGENYWKGGRRNLEVGNTQRIADILQSLTNADVFRIRAADPYSDNYDETVSRNVQEQDSDARPAIADPLPDISSYDTILLGSPIWNMQEPMIMRTFCDNYDFAGKTVYPFVTYAVSGAGRVASDYATYCKNAKIGETLAIRGEEAADSQPQVETWLRDQGLLPSLPSGKQ